MSLASKFPGGGRVAPSAPREYAHLSPSNQTGSSKSAPRAKVADVTRPGVARDTRAISSHNDINRFTSGISMHHPYKERGGAFDQSKQDGQASPSAKSNFKTPSGGTKARAGMKVAEVRNPSNYDNPKIQNTVPADIGRKEPPKAGMREVMNQMKKAR